MVLVKPNLLVVEGLIRNPTPPPPKVVLLIRVNWNDLIQLIKISDLNQMIFTKKII